MINYLWVGPPASREHGVICGQDTFGPKQFNGEHCNFWCLAEYAEHYHAVFADNKNVAVMPIEPYLAELISSTNPQITDYATRTLALFKILLSDERNRVRDRVTAKELLSFLLCFTEGGYVADSNVLLKDPAKLIARDHFSIPCFNTSGSFSMFNIDFWMLYSPPLFERTRLTLELHIDAIEALEQQYAKRTPAANNTERVKQAYTIEAFFALLGQATLSSPANRAGIELLATRGRGSSDAERYIDALSVEKHLFNTHKHATVLNQAFMYVQSLNFSALTHLLTSGEDINQTMDLKPFNNITLLHFAVWHKKPEAIPYLLSHKIDTSRQLTYTDIGKLFTASELAMHYYEAKLASGAPDATVFLQCYELLAAHADATETISASCGGGSASSLASSRLRLMPKAKPESEPEPERKPPPYKLFLHV
ncbi:MAG: hypothetical protein P1U63_10315 [Coxiellaceae bacterium]|nr:hypothetical protein [Coxiellaceae bacterium]